jgi:hypothetical protein
VSRHIKVGVQATASVGARGCAVRCVFDTPHPFLRWRHPSSAALRTGFTRRSRTLSRTIDEPASLRSDGVRPPSEQAFIFGGNPRFLTAGHLKASVSLFPIYCRLPKLDVAGYMIRNAVARCITPKAWVTSGACGSWPEVRRARFCRPSTPAPTSMLRRRESISHRARNPTAARPSSYYDSPITRSRPLPRF